MFLLNKESHFAVTVLLSAWLFIVASCNEGPRIDRVSITPIVPSGQRAERIDVTTTSTPAMLEPGQQAELALDVTQKGSDLKVQWYAPGNKGHFTRPTDSLTTTFVAPNEIGPVDVACQVAANGETKTIHLPIVVAVRSTEVASVTPPPNASPNVSPNTTPQSTGPYDIDRGGFIPCAWMGDAEAGEKYLQVQEVKDRTPTGSTATKWNFRPGGKQGWLAVGWQYGQCNWGDSKGVDLRGRALRRVSIWVKGVPDSEQKLPVMQFKAGGNADPTKKYKPSFSVAGEFITVSNEWQQYHLDIPAGEDLSSIISAFTIVLRTKNNPNGATFYVGDITYNSGN